MSRIPTNVRVFVALCISFFAIHFSPPIFVNAPHVPTSDELFEYIFIPTSSFIAQLTTVKMPQSWEQAALLPTETPPEPTITETIPSDLSFPTPTPELVPTLLILPTVHIPTIIPTLRPTVRPTQRPAATLTPVPTRTPTSIPTVSPIAPTSAPGNVLSYTKLNAFVANMPQIGCYNNTISGCAVDTLYQTPLDKGLGWATYYGDEHNAGYNVVADVIHNNKGITVEAARAFIEANYMQKQSQMTPDEAKKTGKVIAFGATRTPKDLWKIKYVFGIDNPKNPQARFIGRIMIIDCAATNDWRNSLSTLSYSYVGWTKLNWIVDLSKNGFIQLPTGYSGRPDNTGEGRPGVILVDETSLNGLIY